MSAATDDAELLRLARSRWRVSMILTTVMLVVYFGFILLTAFGTRALGSELVPGLSVGILLGALVIVTAFMLTGLYVRWANQHYDPALRAIQSRAFDKSPPPGTGS